VHFCTKLLEETGVAVSPGIGFGNTGEGYIRLALAQDPETLEKAVKNISEFMKNV
jgi:aspartate/methionine/tyrosine aminotransferase